MPNPAYMPDLCDRCDEPADELAQTLTGTLICLSCWAEEEAQQNEPTLAG